MIPVNTTAKAAQYYGNETIFLKRLSAPRTGWLNWDWLRWFEVSADYGKFYEILQKCDAQKKKKKEEPHLFHCLTLYYI